jgi:NitT/TauT family transport system permease protein
MKKVLISIVKTIAVLLFWVFIWFLVSKKINNDFLFPSPKDTFQALRSLVITSEFWGATLITLCRILYGIIVSLIIGCGLAVITTVSSLLKALLTPVMNAAKSVPVACFIILAWLWLDTNVLPIFITALIVIPIVWSNVSQGIASTDKKLLEVAQIFNFSSAKKLFKIYIPSIMPYFIAACRAAFGMAWKAGIAAEVLTVPKQAIGTEIYFSKLWFETPTLFAWTIVIIILSYVIEKLLILAISMIAKKLHIINKGDRYAED